MRAYCQHMRESYGNTAEAVIERKFQRTDGKGYYCVKNTGEPDLSYAETIRGFVGIIRSELGAKIDYTQFYKDIAKTAPGVASDAYIPMSGLKSQTARGARFFVDNFPGIAEVEGYCYRNIAGSGSLSDHAKGLAVDLMMKEISGKDGKAIADYAVQNADALQIRQVIWDGRIWTQSKPYWHDYHPACGKTNDTQMHRDHVHLSFKAN